ncbi:hypothetical protein [Nocardia sp. bgisy118]|uniref:hypothetical protein n=1 Tax=Nocardia sp. bgisy118 TaxID=3413786 RepID=UPI003F49BC8C
MLTLTMKQFRKAAASSPQQACVRVYRDSTSTWIWDDKLADPSATADTLVPTTQCLTFDHDEFDAYQAAVRAGDATGQCLRIAVREPNTHVFTAAVPAPEHAVELCFDHAEYSAFLAGIRNHEFDLSVFQLSQPTGRSLRNVA